MLINRKEAVIAAIEHKEGSLVPYTFCWEPDGDIPERLDAYFGNTEWRSRYKNYIVKCGSLEDGRHVFESDPPLRKDYFGSVWRGDCRPIHLEEPVLKTPSLKGYSFPDPEMFVSQDWQDEVCKTASENADCFLVGYPGFGLFERSWSLRGFENLLMDSAAEPNFFADLMAAVGEHFEKMLTTILELPINGIFFGDDWGDQRGVIIGPERWRQFIKPHYKRIYSKVKEAGKYVLSHCCGSIVDIMPDVIEIGLDVLESVQPEARGMNPYELKQSYGDKLTFWGGLGSQSIIPFGSPEELTEEIRKLGSQMTKDGGYILSGSKALQVETPTENAVTIFKEFIALGEPKND